MMNEHEPVQGKLIIARRIRPKDDNAYTWVGVFRFVAFAAFSIFVWDLSLILSIILGLIAIVSLLMVLRAWWVTRLFRAETISTKAKILEKSANQLQLRIQFESFEITVILNLKSKMRVRNKSTITVHYARANPRVALLRNEYREYEQEEFRRKVPSRFVPKPNLFWFLAGIPFLCLGVLFLRGYRNHEVTLTSVLIIILPSLLIYYGGLRSLWHTYQFKSSGILAEGFVIDRFHGKSQSRDDDPGDFLIFQFHAPDKLVILRAEVQPTLYKNIDRDESIQIYYATSNPRVALIEGEW